MRTSIIPVLVSAVAVLSVSQLVAKPARAEIEYPWCAQYGAGGTGLDATNCGFVTLKQCRDTISGIGGDCYQNPRYAAALNPSRRRHEQLH
jgi:hypothetical protein